jgi:hypothetical protein
VDNASPSEAAAMIHHQLVLLISHFSSKHGHMREIEQSICANLMNAHIGKVLCVCPMGCFESPQLDLKNTRY